MTKQSVHVLGGGIAGVTCAITLASSGSGVVVHEKRTCIGSGFTCTAHAVLNYRNLFTANVVHVLRETIGLQIENSFHPVRRLRRYSPGGYSHATENWDEPILYAFLRGNTQHSLDRELLDQALELGVEVRYGSTLAPDKCRIVATGSRYCDFVGYAVHYEVVDLDYPDELKAFFSTEFAPRGYGYILPFKNGSATVAVVVSRKHLAMPLKSYYERFLEHLAANLDIRPDEKHALAADTGRGHYNLHRCLSIGNTLFVGGAAGLVTADYGFGIKNAMLSGYLAARAILEGLSYDRLVAEHVFPELAHAYFRRLGMNRQDNVHIDRLILRRSRQASGEANVQRRLRNRPARDLLAWMLNRKRRCDYPLVQA